MRKNSNEQVNSKRYYFVHFTSILRSYKNLFINMLQIEPSNLFVIIS
jgi:hypothetical protein